jgi:hypothetical protein
MRIIRAVDRTQKTQEESHSQVQREVRQQQVKALFLGYLELFSKLI